MSYGAAFLSLRGTAASSSGSLNPATARNLNPSTTTQQYSTAQQQQQQPAPPFTGGSTATTASFPTAAPTPAVPFVPQRQFTFRQTTDTTQSVPGPTLAPATSGRGRGRGRGTTAAAASSPRGRGRGRRSGGDAEEGDTGAGRGGVAQQVGARVLATLASNPNINKDDVYIWRCVSGGGRRERGRRGGGGMKRTLLINEGGSFQPYTGTAAHNIWKIISGKVAVTAQQRPLATARPAPPTQAMSTTAARATPVNQLPPAAPVVPIIGGPSRQQYVSVPPAQASAARSYLPTGQPTPPMPAVRLKSARVPPAPAIAAAPPPTRPPAIAAAPPPTPTRPSAKARSAPPPKPSVPMAARAKPAPKRGNGSRTTSSHEVTYRDLGMEASFSDSDADDDDEEDEDEEYDSDDYLKTLEYYDDNYYSEDEEEEEDGEEWERLSAFSDVGRNTSNKVLPPPPSLSGHQPLITNGIRVKEEEMISIADDDDAFVFGAVNLNSGKQQLEPMDGDREYWELRRRMLALRAGKAQYPAASHHELSRRPTEVIELSDDDEGDVAPPSSKTSALKSGSKRPRDDIHVVVPFDTRVPQNGSPPPPPAAAAAATRHWGPIGTRHTVIAPPTTATVCVDESITVAELFMSMARGGTAAPHNSTGASANSTVTLVRSSAHSNRYEEPLDMDGLRDYEHDDLMLDPDETLGGYTY